MKTDRDFNPLHGARIAAGLELRDLEMRTRISPAMLKYMDEGEFGKLPAGIYARAWVRSVAAALGLDPDGVLREVEPLLRPAEELVPPAPQTRPGTSATPGTPPALIAVVGRLTASERWRRAAAAALDSTLLSAISVVIWMVATGAGGTRTAALGVGGATAVALVTAIVAAIYFLLFAGIGGRTPGAAAMGVAPYGSDRPLALADIGRRALDAVLQESSILIDWLVTDVPMLVDRRRVQV